MNIIFENCVQMDCFIEKREGISKKTGNPYTMYMLHIPSTDSHIILNNREIEHYKIIYNYERSRE